MALPSYGPGQYVMQIDDALLLHPQQVIVAVYLGNDFFDTYLMAKRHSAALGTALSAELRNSANALEVAHPLEPELERLWVSAEPAGPVPTPNSPLRRWVSQHLKLWRGAQPREAAAYRPGTGDLGP
jgi:hypothetical protein